MFKCQKKLALVVALAWKSIDRPLRGRPNGIVLRYRIVLWIAQPFICLFTLISILWVSIVIDLSTVIAFDMVWCIFLLFAFQWAGFLFCPVIYRKSFIFLLIPFTLLISVFVCLSLLFSFKLLYLLLFLSTYIISFILLSKVGIFFLTTTSFTRLAL